MSLDTFATELRETGTECYVFLSGDLDLSASMQFRSAIRPVVNKAGQKLVLDLGNLKYIDSTGIGIIISILKLREAIDGEFYVRNVPDNIQRLLDITGVSTFLEEGS